MDSFSREFALFIDGIRLERGTSRLDLIDGIVSLSQYKRYLRGVTAIPNDIVLELASRLKYSITDLYTLYTKKHSKEDIVIRALYEDIQKGQYHDAQEKIRNINPDTFVSEYYTSFYDYIMIHLQHITGRVSDIHVLSMYSELINYPDCMTNESFNLVDLNVLYQIVKISGKLENYQPSELLYNVIKEGNLNFSSASDVSVLPGLFYTVSRVFYKRNELIKTIELTEKGIELSVSNSLSKVLPHLFLLNSIAKKKIDDLEGAYDSIKKCFLQLIITGDKQSIDFFKKSYDQYFDISLNELLQDISTML